MTIANKLQTLADVKTGIKTALTDRGVDLSGIPFTQYPAVIADLPRGGEVVGQLVYNTLEMYALNGLPEYASDKYLVCDGSLISAAEWPELAAVLKTKNFDTINSTILRDSRAVSFSPDGNYLAVGYSVAPYLVVYDTTTWEPVADGPSSQNYVADVIFSPDGALLIVAHSGTGRIKQFSTVDWSDQTVLTAVNVVSGFNFSDTHFFYKEGYTLRARTYPSFDFAFNVALGSNRLAVDPTGSYFLITSNSGAEGYGLYDAADGTLVSDGAGTINLVKGACFSPNGLHFFTVDSNNYLRKYLVSDRSEVAVTGPLTYYVGSDAIKGFGDFLLAGNHIISLADMSHTVFGEITMSQYGGAISDDGAFVALASNSGSLAYGPLWAPDGYLVLPNLEANYPGVSSSTGYKPLIVARV